MVVVVQMNKVVMKVNLFAIEDKESSTNFGFMSFMQVETYTNLCVAFESKCYFLQAH